MKRVSQLVLRATFLFCLFVIVADVASATSLRFEVSADKSLTESPLTGRLLVILDRHPMPGPRLALEAGHAAPFVLGRDVNGLIAGKKVFVDEKSYAFPATNLSQLPPADYWVQALLMTNTDIRSPNSYGNLYSEVTNLHLDPSHGQKVKLRLSERIPDEQVPADNGLLRYVKIQSPLLSDFHGHPVYLRAGIILPRDFDREPSRQYPVWVRIGGWGTRYTMVQALMATNGAFRKLWLADDTPRMILLQLDGAGPFGDPYQVNSANNGPYGDAITQELIPYVEKKFRGIGQQHARVLSGLSTGGWVSLALQVFYPDYFNGTWTFCPDGVDFRAFELVNIYKDTNAYINQYGCERPSERAVNGDIRLYMRREVRFENLLGAANSWTLGGKDWSAWNAVYGPRGADGKPTAIWDPETGVINHAVAEQWKKYDLRLVMEENWKTLGPKLRGKLHISVGDADNYFLNNAVHLLDDFLSHADPPYKGRIVYGAGKGHGWRDIDTKEQLHEMDAATRGAQN